MRRLLLALQDAFWGVECPVCGSRFRAYDAAVHVRVRHTPVQVASAVRHPSVARRR